MDLNRIDFIQKHLHIELKVCILEILCRPFVNAPNLVGCQLLPESAGHTFADKSMHNRENY